MIQNDLSATLACNNDQTLFVPIENHPNDSRVKISDDDVCQTLTSRCGTGGGNVPMIMEKVAAYGICSKESNAMKSDNPNSGFYKADTARTIDTSNQSPCKNQGGMVVIEGNGSRPSHKGDGYSESDTMYTLNTVETHGVAYGIDRAAFNQGKNAKYGFSVDEEVEPTIVAKGPNAVGAPLVNIGYIVRRLTPKECALLQGMPTWWCDGLESEDPTDEEIDKWMQIFEEYRQAVKPQSKPKTRKMVAKWLKDPHSDSAEYTMWGNGIAMPCAYFVLSGIAHFADKEAEEEVTPC